MMKRSLWVAAALLLGLAACGSEPAALSDGVSAAALGERLDAVVVLDVRTAEEFAAGHIEGAVNIDLTAEDFAAKATVLDPAAAYVVHCSANVPNGRSEKAMATLADIGFSDVQGLIGGYAAWVAAQPADASP